MYESVAGLIYIIQMNNSIIENRSFVATRANENIGTRSPKNTLKPASSLHPEKTPYSNWPSLFRALLLPITSHLRNFPVATAINKNTCIRSPKNTLKSASAQHPEKPPRSNWPSPFRALFLLSTSHLRNFPVATAVNKKVSTRSPKNALKPASTQHLQKKAHSSHWPLRETIYLSQGP